MYAYVATSKYADHVSLHRLQNIQSRQGAHLSKQVMWDLMVRLDELVAGPVLKEMRRQLLEERVLQADERTVTVQREGEMRTRIWLVRSSRRLHHGQLFIHDAIEPSNRCI